MKALQNIQYEAQQIVIELADREINRLKGNYNLFEVWMSGKGNPMVNSYRNEVDLYASVEKYVYMTQYKSWNRELNQYELPSEFPNNYRAIRNMYYDKSLANMVYELRLLLSPSWEARYREDFIAQNMAKLNRALAKHIDDIKSLNGYFHAYHSGPMAGKKDEGYVAIQDEYDLEKYITDKLGNVVKKVVLIEKEKDYPYNMSNPYFDDIYDVELKDGRKFQVVRSYGRPNWAGNVSYKEQIQVKYA